MLEPLLARVLVPFSLMTCAALEQKHGLWTALTMGLVYITVLTVRMQDFAAKLGWNVCHTYLGYVIVFTIKSVSLPSQSQ